VNRSLRFVGVFLMLLFVAMVAQLTNLQVVQASKLSHDPRNNRNNTRAFDRNRGVIQTSDGVIIAQSVPVGGNYKYQRTYPTGSLFGFITGYQSLIYGTDGVERTYGNLLDGSGLPIRLNNLGRILDKTQPTGDVTLTLSNALQKVATAALGTHQGSVVALDPTTGAVLAMVSQPSYDPNFLANHDADIQKRSWDSLNANTKPLLARAFRDSYPPGSTFKVVTSAAVLDKMPELATKVYPTLTALPLPQTNNQLHNFGGESCGGALPDILRVSCDTAFGQVGLDLGKVNLAAEAAGFGFGAKPPLDLPSPAASQFTPDLPGLSPPGLAFSAIGQQSVSATPLQMALIAAAVANHGVIMRPHVLNQVRDNDGHVVQTYSPAPWMQATSVQTADTLNQYMIGVVSGPLGTGSAVALPGTQVAAKTGTAETGTDKAGRALTNAWMIAFAPAEAPRIAVAVVVPGLTGVGNESTGGAVAAPIVRTVLAAYLGLKS
jgi:peptidoglycan glycosyltransferase